MFEQKFNQLVLLVQNAKILAGNLAHAVKLVLKINKQKDVSYDNE